MHDPMQAGPRMQTRHAQARMAHASMTHAMQPSAGQHAAAGQPHAAAGDQDIRDPPQLLFGFLEHGDIRLAYERLSPSYTADTLTPVQPEAAPAPCLLTPNPSVHPPQLDPASQPSVPAMPKQSMPARNGSLASGRNHAQLDGPANATDKGPATAACSPPVGILLCNGLMSSRDG